MRGSELFSIIVPVYNVENYLKRCLDSLCQQTYTDIEIIVVDDGSTDNSFQICSEYAVKDNRIRVIRQENKGLSAARNTGVNSAVGEYMMFVDSDDYVEEDTCEILSECIKVNKPDIIVGEAVQHISDKSTYMRHTNLSENVLYSGIQYSGKAIEAREWYAPVWLCCYKRTYLEEEHIRFKEGIVHEDIEIEPRLFLQANRIFYINKAFYHYCIREGSLSDNSDKKKRHSGYHDIIMILSEWKKYFENEKYSDIKVLLNGMLVKQFLYFSRYYKTGKRNAVEGMDFSFQVKYGLDIKEKLKVIAFNLFPKWYVNI